MDRSIPDPYIQAIGSITVEFADLELSIVDSIAKLMFDDDWDLAIRLVGGDSFEVLLQKLMKMFMFRFSDEMLLKEFKEIINHLEKIKDKRNKYLHSYWYIDKNNVITRLKFNKRPDKQKSIGDIEETTVETLFDFADELSKALNDLYEFIKKAMGIISQPLELKSERTERKKEEQNQNTETRETPPS